MNNMNDADSNILARIDERTQAQGITLTAHVREDAEKFEKVFTVFNKRFDKIDERFDKTDEKLDTLWDDKNQRKGAFTASKLLTSGIYAVIALVAGYFGSAIHK